MEPKDMQTMEDALPIIPSFGEFDLYDIADKLNRSQPDKKLQTIIERCIYISDFLVDNGFAKREKYRNDWGRTTIELTDPGRTLKECGSYQAYLDKKKEDDANALRIKEQQEAILNFESGKGIFIKKRTLRIITISLAIAFITLLVALYNASKHQDSPADTIPPAVDRSK